MLLWLFAFSITPKKSLHDVFTHHKDQAHKRVTTDATEVSKAGFNCKTDNLVAESPFTQQQQDIELASPPSFPASPVVALQRYYYSAFFFFELRGPPAVTA